MAALHVLDAAFVGGEDLTRLDVKARADVVSALCRAVNKPTRVDYVRLRPKELLGLEHLPAAVAAMQPRVLKSGGMRPRLTHPVAVGREEEGGGGARYFVPTGVLMFRVVQDPYMISLSRSQVCVCVGENWRPQLAIILIFFSS